MHVYLVHLTSNSDGYSYGPVHADSLDDAIGDATDGGYDLYLLDEQGWAIVNGTLDPQGAIRQAEQAGHTLLLS